MTNVTLKDIAQALGISINSVSHALRDMDDISEATKAAVRAKADELGYVSNSIATDLKNGNTNLIGLVYDNLGNPYFSIMASKLVKSLSDKGFSTIVVPSSSNHLFYDTFLGLVIKRVNGIISFLEPDSVVAASPLLKRIPLVLLGRKDMTGVFDCVYTDDEQGGRLAAERLLSFKPDVVGYLGPDSMETTHRRFIGFSSMMKDAKININRYIINDDSKTIEIARRILSDRCRYIFAFNDILANAIINNIREMDNDFAKDIVIVGYDNIKSVCPYFCDIDSVSHDFDKAVSAGVELLLDRISKKPETRNKCVVLPVSLHKKINKGE